MLARPQRMVRSDDYRAAVKLGHRATQPALVAHVCVSESHPTRVGFVVSRAVGNAVSRNRVKRRLRHVMAERMSRLESGSHIVIRALPASAFLSSAALARQVDNALLRAGALIGPERNAR